VAYAEEMEEPRWLTDAEQCQWRALLNTVRLFNRALERQMLRDAGLPHAYFGILVTLAEAPEQRMRMGDLAAELDFSPSRLSHAVARMEAAGWVRRRPRPSSGRERDAQLTEKGSAVLTRAAPPHVSLVRKLLFDHLDPEELQTLQTLCERLGPALVEETADCNAATEYATEACDAAAEACDAAAAACDTESECLSEEALMELPRS